MNRPKAILFGAALAATLPAFNGPAHAAESTDPVTLTASYSPGSGLYNLRLTLTDGPKHASNFAVDTGSTGILGGAAFFGLTAREKDPAKCTTFGYSSSGNSYTAYPVTRSFNLSTPGKRDGYARVEEFTVLAVDRRCPRGTKAACGEPSQQGCVDNPKIFMMGVGFKNPAGDGPVNPGNPLLQIEAMTSGKLPRTYLIGPVSSDGGLPITLGIAAADVPPLDTGARYDLPATAGALAIPTVAFALEGASERGTQAARLLPDTGIGYGILAVDGGAPCCVDPALSCPRAPQAKGKTLANDTTVVLYDSPEGGQELTRLTYSDKTPGSRCLRWSTGHPKSAGWLYNSGQDFFRNCGLFFDPTARSARIDCKQS